MAGIDKIYITGEQFPLFYDWIEKVYKKCTKETGLFMRHYLYYDIDDAKKVKIKPKETIPVSNFPEEIDMWILKKGNCDLKFIRDKVKEQYGIK